MMRSARNTYGPRFANFALQLTLRPSLSMRSRRVLVLIGTTKRELRITGILGSSW
jgi:hypothetical protein